MIITSDFHVKRYLTLLSRYLSKEHIYYYGDLDNITDKDIWFNNNFGRKIIKREMFLFKYKKRNIWHYFFLSNISSIGFIDSNNHRLYISFIYIFFISK